MFRIKICGITRAEDARHAAAAGADAIGLNFYAKSPRFVEIDLAREIAGTVGADVAKVGVFVNSSVDDVRRIGNAVGLDMIQVHGDEPPEFLSELGERPIIRAFRCRSEGLGPVREYLRACRRQGSMPMAVLLDAFDPGQYGGTGKVVDWPAVAGARKELGVENVVLAGGLRPDNVRDAILQAMPSAVDTASGVESSPGMKDPRLVERFVESARDAFSQMRAAGE